MISHDYLTSILNYDPDTGVFTRNVARGRHGRHKAGEVCGTLQHGYFRISIDGRFYWAHRLAWFYVHGKWPKECIDHINMNRQDNRLSNLREATHSQNFMNTGKRSDNTSGYKGVSRVRKNGKWEAYVHQKGKKKNLGYFNTKEEAAQAYVNAATNLYGNYVRHDLLESGRE